MADSNQNVRIDISAQDNLSPVLQRSVASLDLVQRALDQFDRQMQAAGTSQEKMGQAITQANQFLQALGTSTTAAGQTLDKFGASIDRGVVKQLEAMQAGVRAANTDLGQLQQFGIGAAKELAGVGTALGGMSTALGVATSILAAFGVSLSLRGLVEFGKDVVETGIKIQGLQLAFKGIGGSAQSGAADFAFITRESQRLGLELVSTATTFRNFEAAAKGTSLEGQQAREIFTGFATAARGLGIQGADLNRVFFALDRMMQTNVINMRELRQLSMAMPGSMEAFAHALGTTTAGLAEMTKSGTLLATETLPAVAQAMLAMSGGAAGDIGTQASTAFARLNNELTLLRNNIAQSGLLDLLRSLAEYAASILESGRKAGEQRQREAGGPLAALPTALQGMSPAMEARQREIARLQESLLPQTLSSMARTGGMPDLGLTPLTNADREAIRTRVQALMEEQQQAIKSLQQRLGAEVGAQGGTYAGKDTSFNALVNAEDKIRTLFEEGRKKLAEIDLNAQFIPSLTVAEDKLKSWQETLKAVGEELAKLNVPLRQSMLGTSQEPASPFRSLIGPLAATRGLDPLLIEALVKQESNNNPLAVSRAGAKGLMQLMPGTAAQYGAGGREFDPESNLRAGIAYLADLLKMFSGDVVKALTAYNAGPAGKGIPQATGENATFALQVLARMPTGVGGVVAQGTAQEAALRGAVEAGKPDTERLAQTRATGRAYLQALDEEMRAQDQAAQTLQRLIAAYTQTKEARDEDTAALLKAKFPQNEAIQQAAETVISLAATRAAYKEEVDALNEKFVALKQTTDAQRDAEKAQADYLTKLQDTLAVLNAPKDERTETRLRALAQRQGVTLGPTEEGVLGAITAREKALAQEKEMERLAQSLARNIQSTFDNLWEQVFTGGVTSLQSFALLVVQSLQKTFAQFTAQLMNQLLNAATGTTDDKGGWAGALAKTVVGLGAGLLGSGTASAGEAAGAIQGFRDAGFTGGIAGAAGGGVFPGLGMIRALAGGGIVQTPSFALIGENQGHHEAVVPLPDNRSIPVSFTGQQSQQSQPVIIELHQNFDGAYDPRMNRTSKKEVISWVINDYKSDGPTRRTFNQR